MGINEIIMYIMVIFMVIGALDKCFGNRFGYGKKFEEGFMAMGALALAMVGIISFAPVLARLLSPVITPAYQFLGADPAMFATTLLANDMGGYPLAMQLARTPEAGAFAGLVLGAMMGATIVFTIPVALSLIPKEDRDYLAKGVLAGMITIPIGCFVGGIAAGFHIRMILSNLAPIVIFAGLICIGLWRIPRKMIDGFNLFGRAVVVIITLALAAVVVQTLTGFTVIPGMAPISDGIGIIGSIAITLAGAFPFVHFITRNFERPLLRFGRKLGMNDSAAAGLVATLANNIAMFSIFSKMDRNGKVMNAAFAVSAAFVFGDHLGFTAGIDQRMIFPVLCGKLTAGMTAVALAKLMFCRVKGDAGKKVNSRP